MFPSKQKIIKSMFSSNKFKNVEKFISKFFFLNEGIHRSEKSKDVREADDDDGKDVRVLSSSSIVMMVKMTMMMMTMMAVVLMMTIMEATMTLMEEFIILKIICRVWV